MLPWQLLEAHDPGPVYLPAPSETLPRVIGVALRPCEDLSVEMMQAASIAAPRTREMRNRWERSASGVFFISSLSGRDTLPRNQKKWQTNSSTYTTRFRPSQRNPVTFWSRSCNPRTVSTCIVDLPWEICYMTA